MRNFCYHAVLFGGDPRIKSDERYDIALDEESHSYFTSRVIHALRRERLVKSEYNIFAPQFIYPTPSPPNDYRRKPPDSHHPNTSGGTNFHPKQV